MPKSIQKSEIYYGKIIGNYLSGTGVFRIGLAAEEQHAEGGETVVVFGKTCGDAGVVFSPSRGRRN